MHLSVVTVNLNNREGLQKTIDSVQKQRFRDFEFIVVDGASTDGSINLIKQMADQSDENFRWISEPDSGVYEAMNKGIRLSEGEYLLFLNSGDFLIDDRVFENVFSKGHTADILTGKCNVSQKGEVIHTTNPPENITFGFLYNHGLAHQSTFIRRDAFQKYGMYSEDFRYNADIEFWYRTIILQNCSTETLPFIITDYNNHGISTKEKSSETYRKEMIDILSHPVLQKFVPDYDLWRKQHIEMEPFHWARSNKVINYLILSLYRLACRINSIRN